MRLRPRLTRSGPEHVFNDVMQVKLGACGWQDCAAKVLVTVVSRPRPDLARRGEAKCLPAIFNRIFRPLNIKGYGTVVSLDGQPCSELLFERMTEEHGMLRLSGSAARDLKVGDRLLVVPQSYLHHCEPFRQFSGGQGVFATGKAELLSIWPVEARGLVN